MVRAMKTLAFRNGDKMPALGLGTWKSKPGEVGAAVRKAIELGYRHIDCAAIYANQGEIGEAFASCFRDGIVAREELFVTSKLWNDAHAAADVEPALRKTLGELGLDYLDLYLMHWPIASRREPGSKRAKLVSLEEIPLSETWGALEAAAEAGLTRHLGVSNFSLVKLRALMASAKLRAPEANQIELHPYLQQGELVSACIDLGVIVTAYSPLGSRDRPATMIQADEPVLLEDPAIAEIAARRECSAAQVLLAWAIQRGGSAIPKSVNAERLAQNLAAAAIELDSDDMAALTKLDRHRRYVDGLFWCSEGSPYTIADIWNE